MNAITYPEGEAHPVDLGWIACVPLERYNDLLERCPQFVEDIKANAQIGHGYAMVAYLGIQDKTKAFQDEMESYEVYDGKVEWEVFRGLHLTRWRTFAENHAAKEEISVFLWLETDYCTESGKAAIQEALPQNSDHNTV
ncbi:hypothetical protein FACS1894191_2310 [Clostridia bacterium]|nr:hypothetical protein FACS1894191_2310 [Clostridia bacterium]